MVEDAATEEGQDFVVYDFDPYNLPEGYLEAIGLVIAAGSQTDHIMRDFIGALLKTDNIETLALAAHLSNTLKDNIIRSLAELNAPSASELDEIDDLLDRISLSMNKRNSAAHNAFARHPETNEVLSLKEKARGSLQIDFSPVTVEDLKNDAKEIHEAGLALMSFMASRGIGPKIRKKPLREPINRKQKARQKRREEYGEKY